MKVKIYVNWEEREIVDENELQEIKKSRVSSILDNPHDRKDRAYEFLCDRNIQGEELFCMTNEERENLLKEFEKYVAEGIREDVKEDYQEIIIEV